MTDKPTRVKIVPKHGGLFVVGEEEVKKPTKKKDTVKPVIEDKDNVNKS